MVAWFRHIFSPPSLLLFVGASSLVASGGGDDGGCDLASFRVSVNRSSGALKLSLCGDTFSVLSSFSQPPLAGAPAGSWNRFGGDTGGGEGCWAVGVSKANATSWTVRGRSSLYSIARTISLAPDGHARLLVEDTITNRQTDAPLGLAFQNEIAVNVGARRSECTPRPWCKHYTNQLSPCIHVGGLRNELNISWTNSYTATNPAWNPTIFIEGQAGAGGLGLAVLDERWRLQLDMSAAANFTARLDNRGLGLLPGGSHAYRWAIYPVPSRTVAPNGTGGYWDFINRVRADYVPATTLKRLGGWLDYLRATTWSPKRIRNWLAARGFKHIIISGPYGGEPWLGENTNWSWFPSATKGVPVNQSGMLRMLGSACRNLQAIDPEIQCAPAFETAMSPGLPRGDITVKWKDSICIQPDGQPAGYRWTGCQSAVDPSPACQKFIATHGHQYLYYPTVAPPNSYYNFIQQQFDEAFTVANLTSGYLDIFSYAAGTGGPQLHPDHDRWTYDQCDGHSVDLHPNFTIARCKTELSHLTAPARAAVAKAILSRSAESMVVVNDMGVTDAIRELPIHHFLEGVYDSGYTQAHFSTPLGLGYSPGYQPGLAEIGKKGTWWQTWNSDKDVFEDVKDKLKSGLLYYAYEFPEYNLTTTTGNGILSYMFPITPRELFGGCIVGDERVITLHNGSYSFGGAAAATTEAATCVCFDERGERVGRSTDEAVPEPVAAVTTRLWVREKETVEHFCVVPPDGACVLLPSTTVAMKLDDSSGSSSPAAPRPPSPPVIDLAAQRTPWFGPATKVGCSPNNNTNSTASTTPGGSTAVVVDGVSFAPRWFVGGGGWKKQDSHGVWRSDLADFFAQVEAAAKNGLRIFEPAVVTSNGTAGALSGATRQVLDGIIQLCPDALFILRLRVNPAIGEPVVVQCKDNTSVQVNVTYATSHIPTLSTPASTAWLPAAIASVVPLVRAADAAYKGRIIGVHLGGMESLEWDWPGAYSDLRRLGPNSTHCGSTRAFGGEDTDNYYADYSPAMQAAFCSLPGVVTRRADSQSRDRRPCKLPSAAERDTPRTGNAFVCGAANNPDAVRTVAMNQLQAQVMADAIAGLGSALKRLSGGKLLVLAYFGYTLGCSQQRLGSVSHNLVNYGHLAAHSLLSSPALDGFTAPYYYSSLTRSVTAPLLPSGQFSSLTHHNKLWLVEDDTRTGLYNGTVFRSCAMGDLQCTLDLIRRNMYTTALSQHGMYFFDLANQGWFGKAASPSATKAIWQAFGAANAHLSKLDLAEGPLPAAQVAVFFDEMAPKTQPLDSRDRLLPPNASIPGQQPQRQQTAAGPWMLAASSRELAIIGAPVQHFYLADLPSLSPADVRSIRLAVFLNAFAPSTAVRRAVKERFGGGGVSLLFLGPAGLVGVNGTACVTNLSAVGGFTGIDGLRSGGATAEPAVSVITAEAQEAEQYLPGISALVNVSFGSRMPFSPLLHWDANLAKRKNKQTTHVLGRYNHSGLPSLVTTVLTGGGREAGPRAFFSGSPSLPAALIRSIARGAGVHIYSHCRDENEVITLAHHHKCDDVVARGDGLVIHAGNRSGARQVHLPAALRVVDEYETAVCEAPCTAFNVTLRAGESRLFHVAE